MGFCFRFFGRTIGVRTNDVAVLSELVQRLPVEAEFCDDPVAERIISFRTPETSMLKNARGFYLVYDTGSTRARTLDEQEALAAYSDTLELLYPIAVLTTSSLWFGNRHVIVHGPDLDLPMLCQQNLAQDCQFQSRTELRPNLLRASKTEVWLVDSSLPTTPGALALVLLQSALRCDNPWYSARLARQILHSATIRHLSLANLVGSLSSQSD